MKIVDLISYDTTLTTDQGAYTRFSHELSSIGLAITQNHNPVLFIITDHEPIGNTEKSLSFYKEDDGSCGISFHDKDLDIDLFYSNYAAQGLSSVLEDRAVISEILDYPILASKFDFIRTTIEGAAKIDLVRLVVDNIQDFNRQLSDHLATLIQDESSLKDLSDIEIQILLGSNQLTFFDICGIYEWLENNKIDDFDNFPIKVSSIQHQQIVI